MIAQYGERVACQIADMLDRLADDSTRACEAADDHGLAMYEAGAAWALRVAATQVRTRVWPEPTGGDGDHGHPAPTE